MKMRWLKLCAPGPTPTYKKSRNRTNDVSSWSVKNVKHSRRFPKLSRVFGCVENLDEQRKKKKDDELRKCWVSWYSFNTPCLVFCSVQTGSWERSCRWYFWSFQETYGLLVNGESFHFAPPSLHNRERDLYKSRTNLCPAGNSPGVLFWQGYLFVLQSPSMGGMFVSPPPGLTAREHLATCVGWRPSVITWLPLVVLHGDIDDDTNTTP